MYAQVISPTRANRTPHDQATRPNMMREPQVRQCSPRRCAKSQGGTVAGGTATMVFHPYPNDNRKVAPQTNPPKPDIQTKERSRPRGPRRAYSFHKPNGWGVRKWCINGEHNNINKSKRLEPDSARRRTTMVGFATAKLHPPATPAGLVLRHYAPCFRPGR